MVERTALPGGPRVISARQPGSRSFAAAAFVLAGSRLESRDRAGVAHFIEHVSFKGTARYPTTRAVSEAIEGLGGATNAATDRESTVYWVHLPLRDARRGMEMLGELVCRPLLADTEIDREREVIVEEIRSYRDDASQFVFNVFDEAMFGETALGWEIAGDEETVRSVPGQAIRDFWQATYRPANVVVAVVGDLPPDEVSEMVGEAFHPDEGVAGAGHAVTPACVPAPSWLPAGDRFRAVSRPGAQAHLCLGVPALPRDDPEQWTLEILDTLLGDGSSSRLFLKLREEAGLAYDVHSFHVEYADCGALQVYAGVDPQDLPRALEGILGELARLRDEPPSTAELAKARAYAGGRLELRLEESRHLVSWLGAQEALHDRVLSIDEAVGCLEAVTAEAVQTLAARLFVDERLTLSVVAPRGHGRGLDHGLRLP